MVFSLLSSATLGYCYFVKKKVHEYQNLKKEQNEELLEKKINQSLIPFSTEKEKQREKIEAIKNFLRYLIISKAQFYLEKGYITGEDYATFSELWKCYSSLGGNGQAEQYFHKVEQLDIKDEEE